MTASNGERSKDRKGGTADVLLVRVRKGHPLTRAEIDSLRAQLGALLDQIKSGELAASTPMVYRIEGALVALDVALGRSESELLENLLRTS